MLSLDNVPVYLPVARAGSRAVAAVFDYLLWLLLMAVWSLGLFGLGLVIGSSGGTVSWVVALFFLGLFVIDWAFFAVQEITMHGQTLGKRLAGLRVVGRDGGRATVPQLLLRNLVRTPDLIFAIPLLIVDREGRRLGDHLARTRVVHLERQHAGVGVRRVPDGWGPDRVRVVERLLSRAGSLKGDRGSKLADKILQVLEREDPAFIAATPALLDPLTRLSLAFGAHEPGAEAATQPTPVGSTEMNG